MAASIQHQREGEEPRILEPGHARLAIMKRTQLRGAKIPVLWAWLNCSHP